ncbi:hypothetical protein Bca4012_018792 [Brassica carinata]
METTTVSSPIMHSPTLKRFRFLAMGSSEIKSSLKPKLLLTQVKGDSVFVTGDFRAFKCECDSGRWDQHDAISNIADYIYIINISSEEGIEIESGQFESNSSNVSGW